MKSSMKTTGEWEVSTWVGSTWPLILPDIYFHSWAQRWPAPPVLEAEDKCQPHPWKLSLHTCILEIKSIWHIPHGGSCTHPSEEHWSHSATPLAIAIWVLGNERGVCCIFNGIKKQQQQYITIFTSSGFCTGLCAHTHGAAKFPKSICSSYCENNELMCVVQEHFYLCQRLPAHFNCPDTGLSPSLLL